MMRKKHKSYINEKESERNGKKRKNTFLMLFFSFLGVLFFASCFHEKSEENASVEVVESLTEEKCINFAEQLHYSFLDSNVAYINSYINWNVIEKEVVQGDALRKEIFDTLVELYDVAGDFVDMTFSEADVRFITYYQEGEKHYIIFRVFEQPQSLNVYEFEIQGNANELYISDIYDYYSAISIKTSLSREIDFWAEWESQWREKFKSFNLVRQEFEEAMLQGDLKAAFLSTKKLSEEFSALKRFRQMYGLICENSASLELLTGYLEDEVQRIPLTERGRWLPLFYLRSIEENYGEALIALSNLEKEIGQDVYLLFLKGNIYFEMGDYESAVTYFNQALAIDNTVMIFHLGKVHSFISLGLFVEAVETLFVMDDSFDIQDLNWQAEFEMYPDFIVSPEFEEFLNRMDGNG